MIRMAQCHINIRQFCRVGILKVKFYFITGLFSVEGNKCNIQVLYYLYFIVLYFSFFSSLYNFAILISPTGMNIDVLKIQKPERSPDNDFMGQ